MHMELDICKIGWDTKQEHKMISLNAKAPSLFEVVLFLTFKRMKDPNGINHQLGGQNCWSIRNLLTSILQIKI